MSNKQNVLRPFQHYAFVFYFHLRPTSAHSYIINSSQLDPTIILRVLQPLSFENKTHGDMGTQLTNNMNSIYYPNSSIHKATTDHVYMTTVSLKETKGLLCQCQLNTIVAPEPSHVHWPWAIMKQNISQHEHDFCFSQYYFFFSFTVSATSTFSLCWFQMLQV